MKKELSDLKNLNLLKPRLYSFDEMREMLKEEGYLQKEKMKKEILTTFEGIEAMDRKRLSIKEIKEIIKNI